MFRVLPAFLALILSITPVQVSAGDEIVTIGHPDRPCQEDPHCFNRLHHAIPMAGSARPGQSVLMKTRNAFNVDLSARFEGKQDEIEFGNAHPLTGPLHITGAEPGDTLAVTLEKIAPGPYGLTLMTPFAYASEYFEGRQEVMWTLDEGVARSPRLEGVTIPNASFPGVITTLPGPEQVTQILRRESALLEAGGDVFPPDPNLATPAAICGPEGAHHEACLRTIPPREHGGNLDIRYLGVGVTIYLPCFVAGCGLGIGDMHYAQGDGEVGGTAIEIDADVTLTTRLIKGGMPGLRAPRYEGPASLMRIPSQRFFATTGIPVKPAGDVVREFAYLDSPKLAGLENLSRDINYAARDALSQMLDHISHTYGYSRWEAHVIASVAVDMRIGQLVDAPNVGVTAILPLDIFDAK